MTGLTETEHVVDALESGGVDYLTKPINLDELLARIRVHLSNARSAQSARVALDAAGRHLLAVTRRRRDPLVDAAGDAAGRTPPPAATSGLDLVAGAIAGWLARRGAPAPRRSAAVRFTARRAAAELQLAFLGAIGAGRIPVPPDRRQPQSTRTRCCASTFGLTQREAEVLLWIAKGKSNRDIGEILGLSPRTVNKHLEQIYEKLGVENRASAAVKAAHVLHVD